MLSKLLMENTAITEEINDTIFNASPEESPIIVQHQEMMEATLKNIEEKLASRKRDKFDSLGMVG